MTSAAMEKGARYTEIKSFTESDDGGPRVVLASEDGRPTVLHVMLMAEGMAEILSTVNNTAGGKALADAIGEAADKAVLCGCAYGG